MAERCAICGHGKVISFSADFPRLRWCVACDRSLDAMRSQYYGNSAALVYWAATRARRAERARQKARTRG